MNTRILCLITLLLLLCSHPVYVQAQHNGSYAADTSAGDSSKVLPYIISDPALNRTAQQLLQLPARRQADSMMQAFVDSFFRVTPSLLQSSSATIAGSQNSIRGIIRDHNTGEGIPFAQVGFTASGTGTVTEMDGSYLLGFDTAPNDSITVSALGYRSFSRPVSSTAPEQQYDIELVRTENLLREVVIRPGEDPAIALVKKIIRAKPDNNPDKFGNYGYELYNKLELDLVRMTKEQFQKIPMMKPFAFIFNNMDSLSEEKPFLPVFLTETLSDYYFQRSPKKTKEFIKGSQTKGINNESVTQFLGGMYQSINVYNNFIPIFDKQFVSPVNNNGPFYYRYKIIDTQYAYGHRLILVQFAPKRDAENCFIGDFWVADSVFALQRISMDISKNANINLVNRVSLYQEFAPVQDSLWSNVKDKFIADFTVPYGGKKMPGFIGRKTTSYRHIRINDSAVSEVVNNPKLKQDVVIEDGARDKDAGYWNSMRHDSLNRNEKAIYATIDTLNTMPIFTRTKNVILFLTKGTQDVGIFELGPYWSIYNNNPVEGQRFRFSMGTNPNLFKNIYLNGYVAYGTKDDRFKYKMAGLWLLERHPRHRLYASYTSDLDRSISYYSEAATDNVLSSMVRKRYLPYKVAFVKDLRLEHYKEYFNGFSHEVSLLHKDFDPYDPLPSTGIFTDEHGLPAQQVTNTELGLRIRFAYKERFLEGDYYRFSLGSKYPIVSLRLAIGLKGIWNSGYDYQKLTLNVSDIVKLPHFGTLTYNLFAGKHFGTLPYPLLEIHPGNDFYYYSPYAFSMMNRFEFISDQYAGLMIEHNIGGGLFNYIPLLKRAKLRQFWTAKTAVGSLTKANRALNLNKNFEFKTLESDPYLEVGTGVDNIFQLFRIDFVWRVTPGALPNEPLEKRFGIFGSFKVGF